MTEIERNLTTGSVFKTIVSFSLPFLLSYFLQTLYGLADLFFIGRFDSVASTTAVSIGSQVMHMITVVVVGLAMGSTVKIGRAIGAGQKKEASLAIGNTLTLFMSLAILFTIVLIFLVDPIVSIMQTPDDAIAGATDYLRICFVGIPFITAYNIISSIFRGLGDSKSPMYFILVACIVNIVLDILFIGGFSMGPAGAALATTLAQTVSVLVSLLIIRKKQTGISLHKEHFHPDRSVMSALLKVGVPVALQDGFIQIAFLVVTVIANMRGLNDAAAVGIVEKLIGMIFLFPSSMLSTVSALSAQNLGAGKVDRAKKTLHYAIFLCIGYGILAVILMQTAAEPFVGLFTDDPTVIVMGSQYMHGYIWDCILAGIHFCFSGYFCACGKSGISFIHNVVSITLARIPIAYWASVTFANTLFPMGLATTTGSFISVIICIIAYKWLERKYNL